MAMFGSMGAKRSPFDFKPQVYGTPGIGDGLPGATPMGGVGDFISPETRNILDTAPPAKAGFGARDVVGIIGDALSAMGGGQGVYTQMKLRERDTQQRLQMAKQQRQADMEDWRAKFDYERQFPKEAQPTEFERILDAAGFGPEEKLRLLQQRARNTADPLQAVKTYGADGSEGLQFVRPSQMQGGGDPISPSPGAPPPAADGPNSNFMTVDQYSAVRQGLGNGFGAWQSKHQVPVLVNSAEEMARLPAGTPVVSPDGRRGVKK